MSLLSFGEFWLDTINKQLWHGERPVELTGTPFSVLRHLVEHSMTGPDTDNGGQLVTKHALRSGVWRDTHVSDETLRGCIRVIRKALDDDPQQPRYIKTHNKEGWRFVMKVARTQHLPVMPTRTLQPPNGPYDPAWYIERVHEEREVLGCIEYPGRPVVIYGPQGSGKSTLIHRIVESACAAKEWEASRQVIRISMRALMDEHLASFDATLQEIGRLMLDPEQEDDERVQNCLSSLWSKGLDAKLKLKKLVRNHVLHAEKVAYLVLSDVDQLASWRYQDAFFDMLRAWQDAEGLSSLRLIIETSIPPRLFPLGGQSPLWTKARRILVPGMDLAQVVKMAELYGLHPSGSACGQLINLTQGLASLCRHVLYQAAVRQVRLEDLLQTYHPNARSFGVFTEHLEDIRNWIEQKNSASCHGSRNGSEKLLREAIRGISLSPEEAWPWVRKGLLTEAEPRGRYCFRCPLYRDFFAEQSA